MVITTTTCITDDGRKLVEASFKDADHVLAYGEDTDEALEKALEIVLKIEFH